MLGPDAALRLRGRSQGRGESLCSQQLGARLEKRVPGEGVEKGPVRADPGVEDAACLQCGLQAGAVGGGYVLREVHQPVEGRSTNRLSLGVAVVRGRGLRIRTPLPVPPLLRQAVDLLAEPADVERPRVAVPGEFIRVRLQCGMCRLPRAGVDVGRQRALRKRGV